jgi:hypothetical protein
MPELAAAKATEGAAPSTMALSGGRIVKNTMRKSQENTRFVFLFGPNASILSRDIKNVILITRCIGIVRFM